MNLIRRIIQWFADGKELRRHRRIDDIGAVATLAHIDNVTYEAGWTFHPIDTGTLPNGAVLNVQWGSSGIVTVDYEPETSGDDPA